MRAKQPQTPISVSNTQAEKPMAIMVSVTGIGMEAITRLGITEPT